jgi:hypothetical protein
MEQRLTCANHSDEEIVLVQIGWSNFYCPKCGNDYSIGRKVVVLDPKLSKTPVAKKKEGKISRVYPNL